LDDDDSDETKGGRNKGRPDGRKNDKENAREQIVAAKIEGEN
jgi:hypothetical protein